MDLFILQDNICPECGGHAVGSLKEIKYVDYVRFPMRDDLLKQGVVEEHTGCPFKYLTSEIDYDQNLELDPLTNKKGEVRVYCSEYHEWWAREPIPTKETLFYY